MIRISGDIPWFLDGGWVREVKRRRRELRWEDLGLVQGSDKQWLCPSIWSPSSLGIGFLVSGLNNWRDGDPLSSFLLCKYLSQMDTSVVIIYLLSLWISCSPVLNLFLEAS